MPEDLKFSHEPVIPHRMVTDVPRLDPSWFTKFGAYSTCDLADVVGPLYVMSADIAPLFHPVNRIVGQALTAKAWPGDNLAVHGALSIAGEGDVLVVDWRGHTESCGAGAQVLVEPMRRGMRGVVIDGAWRDVDDLQDAGFPVFAKARKAFSPPKARPGEINVTVSCGGVVVEAGDLIVADTNGVAVVPRAHVELVWEHLSATPPALDPGTPESVASAGRRDQFYRNTFAALDGVTQTWGEARSR